jgi:hypothetical protein
MKRIMVVVAIVMVLTLALSAGTANAGAPGYGGGYGGGYGQGYGAGYGGQQVYIVRAGDTLSAVALRFGVSPFELARINGIFNPNLIFTGMRLCIPECFPPKPVYFNQGYCQPDCDRNVGYQGCYGGCETSYQGCYGGCETGYQGCYGGGCETGYGWGGYGSQVGWGYGNNCGYGTCERGGYNPLPQIYGRKG